MGKRILLFNACGELGAGLHAQLAQCGFLVQVVRDIDGAIRSLRESPVAMVIILTGAAPAIDQCRALRMLSSSPMVIIGNGLDEDAVVCSLEAGADSVLSASLSRRELAARIGAILRRRHAFQPAEAPSPPYHVGDLAIDPRAHAVTKGGRRISLTPTEFRLLVALARRAGKVVSHAELLSQVWGVTPAESPEIVRLHIRCLRRKLGDARNQPRLIQSRRAVGYRLVEAAL